MKKYVYLLAALMSAGAFISCSQEQEELEPGNNAATEGKGINFNLGETRTHYTSDTQISWDANDEITIYCEQTQKKKASGGWEPYTEASYTVNNSATSSTITAKGDELCWGGGAHTFFATYGSGLTMKDKTNGIVKCPYDEKQTLVKLSDGTLTTDMSQAYMVSKLNTQPTDNVTLTFTPIMKTLELNVKGMADETHGKNLYIYSIWVTLNHKGKNTLYKDTDGKIYFDYDIANSEVEPAANALNQEITFKYTISDPQSSPIAKDGKLKLQLVLPPVAIAAGDLTVKVKSAGWGENEAVNGKAYTAQKVKLNLPSFVFKESVDLGLTSGLKWATYNVGATSPTEYGDYFVWGKTYKATTGKFDATSGYSANSGSLNKYTKAQLQRQNILDTNGNLKSGYDAATKNMGNSWRMPTTTEINELINSKKQKNLVQNFNGVTGFLYISDNTDNCLFLTYSGYRDSGGVAGSVGATFWYHGATISTNTNVPGTGDTTTTHSEGLGIRNGTTEVVYNSRTCAHPIRAVSG
ncbi:MAG: hypothetical protein HUK02_07985, partial [Bacteroidaceae bacterium]|nr:hypothetical protein [Bacteroidaceae bacterium]